MSLKLRYSAWCELMKRYRSHFAFFWKQRHSLTPPALKADEAEFLPAALALQLAPVSPTARWTARLLMVLIVFLVLWSVLGKVDIIVSASGKIIPSSHATGFESRRSGISSGCPGITTGSRFTNCSLDGTPAYGVNRFPGAVVGIG